MRRSITLRSSSSSCSNDAVIRTASRSWSSKAVVAARIAFDAVSVMSTSEARTIRRSLANSRRPIPGWITADLPKPEDRPCCPASAAPCRDLERSESEGAEPHQAVQDQDRHGPTDLPRP